MVEPGARKLTTERPDATRSGLNPPSGEVGPTLLNEVAVSSVVAAVPWSSKAPTVITSGSSPGAVIVPLNGPEFPADVTTTIPEFHAASAAWSSGFNAVELLGATPSDRLITRMSRRA